MPAVATPPSKNGLEPTTLPDEKKTEALGAALAQIEKQFGRGAIMRLGEASDRLSIETVPTGSLALDLALGAGGIPRGRITEVFGPESSGKSTLAQHIIAEAQKLGGMAAYIDVEHALDPAYAQALGIKVEDLLISQPDTGEQALEICEALVRSNAIDVVVVDSVAALVPRAEIEGEMGDSLPGLQARLMSQALRKLTGVISRSNTAVIFINQLREKVGVFFGNPEVTPGGRALKFYSSVRIELRKTETLKQGTQVIGNRVKAKVVKNKIAPPFTPGHSGINREADLVDLAVEMNIVKKSGSFFSYGDLRFGQGREAAKDYLRMNPDFAGEIEREIRLAAVQGKSAPLVPARDDDEDLLPE
jgi:recombination protein RecA